MSVEYFTPREVLPEISFLSFTAELSQETALTYSRTMFYCLSCIKRSEQWQNRFLSTAPGAGLSAFHVKDGKITRVRPLVFDDSDAKSWKLVIDGREFSPPRKACVAAFSLTEKARVYSEDPHQIPPEEGWTSIPMERGTRRTGANRSMSASAGTGAFDIVLRRDETDKVAVRPGSNYVEGILPSQLGQYRLPQQYLGEVL